MQPQRAAKPLALSREPLEQTSTLPRQLEQARARLDGLRELYKTAPDPSARFEVLGSALDEIEGLLESVRAARAELQRVETRLVGRFDALLRRLRELEDKLQAL